MALQLGSLRDALREAGASEESAKKAAEEVASYENRLAALENKINLLTWMVGFNVAMTAGLLVKALH